MLKTDDYLYKHYVGKECSVRCKGPTIFTVKGIIPSNMWNEETTLYLTNKDGFNLDQVRIEDVILLNRM